MATTDGAVQQDAQAGAEGQVSQTEGAQQQAAEAQPDPRVMEHLERLSGTVGQMVEQFSPVVEAYQQQQGQADPFAELGGEEFVQGLGDAMGLDPQQVMERIGGMVDQRAQQIVADRLGPIEEGQRRAGFESLESKYPDMQDPQKAGELWQAAVEHASEFYGVAPEVAAQHVSPEFVELVYKAGIADQHAQAQSAQGEQSEVQLEQGGASAQQPTQPSRQEQIASAGGASSIFV